ncbi:MAG TPA: signal peptidase I [Candidatus Paceibacterota bacterium]
MKIFNTIIYSIFVIVLLLVAGLFLASLLPIPGNIEVKIVKSGSMEPTIKTGSVVIIKPESSYKVGEVITFGEDSKTRVPTTHRIVAVQTQNGQTMYTTKGDANEDADTQVTPASEVIGKVLLDAPYAGFILDFARQPIGFTFLIIIPAAIIIIDELFRIVNEIKKLRGARRRARIPQV